MDSFDDFGLGDVPFGESPPSHQAPGPQESAAAPPPARVESRVAPSISWPMGFASGPPKPTAARARAGLGVVVAAAGAGVGGVLLGPTGAAMGLVSVGAIRNLYRSQHLASDDPQLRSDAARGLALGVVGLGVVGYLAYRCFWKEED